MLTLYHVWTSIQLAFAGATSYILNWGVWGGLAAGLVFCAFFSNLIPVVGPYLTALRKDLLWAAFGCVLIMFGMHQGGKAATDRCVAQQVVITKVVTKAVHKTTTPAAKRQKDRFDRPEY
jgi:hypothetical protein